MIAIMQARHIVFMQAASVLLYAIVSYCVSCNVAAANYLGIDVAAQRMNLQQGYGKDLFRQQPVAQFNVFVMRYFSSYLGFEVGYEQALTSSYSTFVPAATSQFGISNFTGIASSVYAGKKSTRGVNVLYVPEFRFGKALSIVPALGAVYVRAKANLNLLEFDGDAATPLEQSEYVLNFAANKIVPKCAVRLVLRLHANVMLRLFYQWEQTSLISMHATRAVFPELTLTAKLADASAYGAGLMYRF